jgi:hypothetical protein
MDEGEIDQETEEVIGRDMYDDMNDASMESANVGSGSKSKGKSKSKKKEGVETRAYVFAFQDCVPLCALSPQAAVLGEMRVIICLCECVPV